MWNKNSVNNLEEMSDFLAKYKPSKLIQKMWNFQTHVTIEGKENGCSNDDQQNSQIPKVLKCLFLMLYKLF